MAQRTELAREARNPALDQAVLSHALRGLRLQLGLRVVLGAFTALTVLLVPPVQGAAASAALVAVYLAGSAAFALWAWRGGHRVVAWGWLGLFADLAVLAGLTLVAGVAADESWTADVLVNGFFLVPVLAATQLRPGVCAAVVVPTTIVYLASSVATQAANEEPWVSILLRTLVLAGLGAGCVGLSRIQRSRVATIGGLLGDRTSLLDDLVDLEDRERRELSERLHDGALQYVLAARMDLDDLGEGADAATVARLDQALAESSRLLRSTVTELHPAVLQHAGLARALQDLAEAQARPGRSVAVDVGGWPEDARTTADTLLFGAARELLSNVAKHAEAASVQVTLGVEGRTARLVVADDGRGIAAGEQGERLEEGHIGLHSLRLRVEAAGGVLRVAPGRPTGTVATVEVPVDLAAAAATRAHGRTPAR